MCVCFLLKVRIKKSDTIIKQASANREQVIFLVVFFFLPETQFSSSVKWE